MNKNIYQENDVIENLNNLKTPCFIVHADDFKNNIKNFKSALNQYYPNNIVSYSVKTNSLAYLLSLANGEGCYAEVTSKDEYDLALYSGYLPENIIYNGPSKERSSFYEALNSGGYVNIETKREIEWLFEYNGKRDVHIGIRVNIDLEKICPDEIKEKGKSRFGFDFENGELGKAIAEINKSGIKISGLHIHRTSPSRSLYIYQQICRYANTIIDALSLDLSYIDIGGGYFGNMPGKPDYDDYVRTIHDNLRIDPDTMIIVEPGNGLIASPVDYLISVIDEKIINEDRLLTTDGTRLDIDPFFKKTKYNLTLLCKDHDQKKLIGKQIVTGCTCLENDKITELTDTARISVGDKILFKWEGAYTMTLTPNFINFQPNVYAKYDQKYYVVRRKWTAKEVCQNIFFHADTESDGYLFLNAGRRAQLIKDFKTSLGLSARIIAEDNWCVAPALFFADKYYLGPKIADPQYIDYVLNICRNENIKAVFTCIDPEIELLSQNKKRFDENHVLLFCPEKKTAHLCFDKYEMFRYLRNAGIATPLTFASIEEFQKALEAEQIKFPVFIKPRTGSGSVGAEKINTLPELQDRFSAGKFDYIIQEFMDCEDCDADVYIDAISHKAVSAICKKKIETRIGGASKTIAFRDENLFRFIEKICDTFEFCGPVDMDFFMRDGVYYLSEVNPRFGGAYLHGFGAGLDFPKMIRNNIHGIVNEPDIGNYDDGSIMLMYDDVVMTNEKELRGDYRD